VTSDQWGSGGALEGGGLREFGALVGEGFENGFGAVRPVGEQDGEGVPHRLGSEVGLAGVAVDAIQKRGEIDELVTRFDELEIEDFLLARHGWTFGAGGPGVNREEAEGGRNQF
jgi:hypothetical protein